MLKGAVSDVSAERVFQCIMLHVLLLLAGSGGTGDALEMHFQLFVRPCLHEQRFLST